jgi:hypothetical protein
VTCTLRVRRETGFGIELRRGQFEIQVDGTTVGTIQRDQATDIAVEPGPHTLRMRKGRYTSQERAFDAVDEQAVSFHCHGNKIWPTWLVSFVKPDLAIALRKN